MANAARGEVSTTVGGKAYTLRPTFDSMCQLEDASGGKSIDEIFEAVKAGRLSGLRAVIFALLQDAHGDQIRTLKDASEWIESLPEAADTAMELVIAVFSANAPPESPGGDARPPNAQAGTGVASGSPPLVTV